MDLRHLNIPSLFKKPIVVLVWLFSLLVSGCVANHGEDTRFLSVDRSDSTLAINALDQLLVKGRAAKTGYSRENFGPSWKDVDLNGCDTRNDILNRDLTDKLHRKTGNTCVVERGKLIDPYTGKVIDFVRGHDTSAQVQIDHVVALANAWQTGAQNISQAERESLANDPLNLIAVDGVANQEKAAGDAATWLPPNRAFRCHYVARQVAVKTKYHLWVTSPEKEAMKNVLASCPNQKLP